MSNLQLRVTPPSTPVRSPRSRVDALAENRTPYGPAPARSPLSTRKGYGNRNLPGSGLKGKRKEEGMERRYEDIGVGRGVRAEGSPAREVPARMIPLPYHPPLSPPHPHSSALPWFYTPPLFQAQQLGSSSTRPSLADRAIFNDHPTGVLFQQHTGDVSDSSYYMADTSGSIDDGEDEDMGDVSVQLDMEWEDDESGSEAGLVDDSTGGSTEGVPVNNSPAGRPELMSQANEPRDITPLHAPAIATPNQVSVEAEEISNKIGKAGYVPSRIQAIETRQRRPLRPTSPLPSPKKQRLIGPSLPVVDDGASYFAPSHKIPRTPAISKSSSYLPRLPPVHPASSAPPPPFNVTTAPLTRPSSPVLRPHITQPDLPPSVPASAPVNPSAATPGVDNLLARVHTLSLEQAALSAENRHLWQIRREQDERITLLEEERVRLRAQVRSAEADKVELEKEVMEVRNGSSERLNGMLERLRCEYEAKRAVDGEEMEWLLSEQEAQSLLMVERAGMMSTTHWSNTVAPTAIIKRKMAEGGLCSPINAYSQRTA
ncbi:uncharacterized protein MKK02DRAFT_42112 [Dioszegia hungarica]|uniref:Uncharacterized protein n=1 Tax=Dioszegia hungarica TaxID=4972 RepID=A0AA38HCN4_9TREE|nr:uncharacterized protein MKK02DRAFT_42112 [Dioszegia hungarica]KAI9637743.1 hypothetical protein MKK02DRAFT_42112 [Dioszegia hungarica]